MSRLVLVGLLCLFCCTWLPACNGPEQTKTETTPKRVRGGAVDPKDMPK